MIRKVIKGIGLLFGVLIIVAAALLIYVKKALPDVGPPEEMSVESSQEMLARGAYLANHVMVCMDCHSQRDWSIFAAPAAAGTKGAGGEVHDQRLGFPGSYVSTNLTPAGLSDWTDGEIFRAVTCGVSKDGRPLFPIMPYTNFGKLDRKDIESVIAYIRSLDPIENTTEPSSSDFPMNFIIHMIPQKAELQEMPQKSDPVRYGEYLATAGLCVECHTARENGNASDAQFAGGQEFPFEDGSIVRSSNITPHFTGIGNWTEEQFIQRFKAYEDSLYEPQIVAKGDFQTVMPWTAYAGMTEEDLGAIYAYLMSLPPVENTVTRFTSSKEL